jgi:DNA-directed RNA polymerase specialized sigma24 family protein
MSDDLCSLLMELASPSATASLRNRAAATLQQRLTGWARGRLIGGLLRGRADAEEVALDAVQHVLIKASTGTARFKGSSEGEAYAWCARILDNFALTHLTATGRRAERRCSVDTETESHRATTLPDERSCFTIILRVLEDAQQVLPRIVRSQDAGSLQSAVRCFLESRAGDTIEEQVERYGFSGPWVSARRDPQGMRRARDRVYQYRHRGARALDRAIRAAGARLQLTADDLGLARRFLVGDRSVQAPEGVR